MSKEKKSRLLELGPSPKIAIVYRVETREAWELATAMTKWLQQHDAQVFTAHDQKKVPQTTSLKSAKELSKMNLILVLGGDGTYLHAVRLLRGISVPILGINLGSLGFLTPTRRDEAFATLEQALQNKMKLVPRAMLEVQFFRKGKMIGTHYGLNDVVIERGEQSHLINVAIQSEKFLVSQLKADGIIVSSPTGSTAYNLAAGGPLCHSQVRAIVVTPIAPHSLTSRPMIMPDHHDLRFQIVGGAKAKVCGRFVLDGQIVSDVHCDDEVVVRRSSQEHWMVQKPSHNEFLLLREKLKFGDRA